MSIFKFSERAHIQSLPWAPFAQIRHCVTGIKCKSNSYRKVNGALEKLFCCNTPAYASPLFKTHKMTPDNLSNVDIKDILVRLLQAVGNISTSRITTFLELILQPISADFWRTAHTNFCQDSCQYIGDLLNWKDQDSRNWKAKASVLHCGGRC